jgi:hypothetical protein
MDILTLECNFDEKINNIINHYKLPYNLFYIIPIYKESTNDTNNEKTIKINNITFFIIYFKSIEFQKNNNKNDDNHLGFTNEYNKIKDTLLKSYDINIIKLV